MQVWMESESGLLFIVRPWREPIYDESGSLLGISLIGWLFQYDDGPKWFGTVDSDELRNAFENLGDL